MWSPIVRHLPSSGKDVFAATMSVILLNGIDESAYEIAGFSSQRPS